MTLGWPTRVIRGGLGWTAGYALAGCALAACTVTGSPSGTRPSGPGRPEGGTHTTQVPPLIPSLPATTTTTPATTVPAPPIVQPGWQLVSETPAGVVIDRRTIVRPSGRRVTVARFHAGTFTVNLHVGSQDPPTKASPLPSSARSTVSAAERPLLLAAFNGGFKTATGSGGVEVAGQVLVPLSAGVASVSIDAGGSPRIGVWGQSVPAGGSPVVSVRQNLGPLVESGAPSALINNISAWGKTLGGGSAVARSALGQDSAGNLLYAASMSALPIDLAQALIDSGATTAMELDINPEWVQLDLAFAPGGQLNAGVPGQHRPADQYLSGWTRDFFTILAKH